MERQVHKVLFFLISMTDFILSHFNDYELGVTTVSFVCTKWQTCQKSGPAYFSNYASSQPRSATKKIQKDIQTY